MKGTRVVHASGDRGESRRSFLVRLARSARAVAAGAFAVLASRRIPAAGAGREAGMPVPPLKPLTRDELYREHDLAG